MNVPSSISSSNQRLPRLKWHEVLGGGLVMLLATVLAMEVGLALRGIQPSLLDSQRLWQQERLRADALGNKALALVGASRILLDADIPTLRLETGQEPVQLAIEGGSFVPVLDGLAKDPGFRGTVMVEMDAQFLTASPSYDTAYQYQDAYAHSGARQIIDYRRVEDYLDDGLHSRMRSYADGASPLTSLLLRLLSKPVTVQYLKMLPDREVLGDYKLAPMPYLYFFRALRNLDGSSELPPGLTYPQLAARIETGIAALHPVDDAYFRSQLPKIAAMADAIAARSGRVIFVVFPESGYVREIDERRYPRTRFWDPFTAAVPTQSLDFRDDPILSRFTCPDGSHLDYRQRIAFTDALVRALHLWQKKP
jgi:hypothetical protein